MFKEENHLKSIQTGIWLIITFIAFYLLYIGDFIFIPFVASLFLLVLFYGVFSFFKKYLKNNFLSVLTTVLVFLIFAIFTGFIIFTQAKGFVENSSKFAQGFDKIFNVIEAYLRSFGIEAESSLEMINEFFSKINYSAIGKNVYGKITGFLTLIGTIFIFIFFIFLERKEFRQKAKYLFDVKGFKLVQNIFLKISSDLNTYFSTKFFLALLNGTIATIIMSLFGLEFAMTFGLVVFFMDFIPIIGAIIALGLPFLYSLVTFDSLGTSFLMLVSLYVPQIITGNFIEPKFMGDRLNLSSLVIIISLLFWGQLWGIMGAFLATPIMAVLNIILSKIDSTKSIALLLSKSGK